MSGNVADQFFDYAVNAQASYGADATNSANASAVNGWTPVRIDAFRQTSHDFSAQMYTDGQGHYRFSMCGSETSNYEGDFRTADAAPMAGQRDGRGKMLVATNIDVDVDGETVTRWMQGLVAGLRRQLEGPGYSVVSDLLPGVGFPYDQGPICAVGAESRLKAARWRGYGQKGHPLQTAKPDQFRRNQPEQSSACDVGREAART